MSRIKSTMLEHSLAPIFANFAGISRGDANLISIPSEIYDTEVCNTGRHSAHEQPAADCQPSKRERFSAAILHANALAKMEIPPRKTIIVPWFREGSLVHIFGARGSGKTWFAWEMAISISKGEKFGPWDCGAPCKVLYADGEMALESMKERMLSIDPNPSENLMLLSHEQLANKSEMVLNLCRENQQKFLLDHCVTSGVKVVVIDNLSCLLYGMRENEADSWDPILRWLLELRRSGVAVVVVHHANRTGNDMRGTSRREDAANWVIKIEKFSELDGPENGTKFTASFTKNRDDNGNHERALVWNFTTADGRTDVTWKKLDSKASILGLIGSDGGNCKDIASRLGTSPANVSKSVKKFIAEGRIRKNGGKYVLV
ncbi:MAG: AAA family ATPase [Puniceicoccales bacterium]|nr:AAA family ATPase [Puniceicoccales bacterium]